MEVGTAGGEGHLAEQLEALLASSGRLKQGLTSLREHAESHSSRCAAVRHELSAAQAALAAERARGAALRKEAGLLVEIEAAAQLIGSGALAKALPRLASVAQETAVLAVSAKASAALSAQAARLADSLVAEFEAFEQQCLAHVL